MPCQFSLGYVGTFKPEKTSEESSTNSFGSKCQFDFFDENHLIILEGKKWCPFHLPLVDSHGHDTEKKNWNHEKQDHYKSLLNKYIEEQIKKEAPINLSGLIYWDKFIFPKIKAVSLDGTQGEPYQNIPEVALDKAYFPNEVDFSRLYFFKIVYARYTTFNGDANFSLTQFADDANFSDSAFNGNTIFVKSNFKRTVRFRGAQFESYLNFIGASFDGIADFSLHNHIRLIKTPLLSENPLKGAFFKNARFLGHAIFNDRTFTLGPDFENAQFSIAPWFYNSTFHQSVNFDGAKFRDPGYSTADHSYRALKLAMEKLGARDEQAMFFALEQQARARKSITPKSIKFFSHLYGLTSDYGQSFVRPLLWLSLAAIFFGFIYTINLLFLKSDQSLSFYFIANFTLEQLTRPFLIWAPDSLVKLGISSNPTIEPTGAELTLKIFSTLHTLISIGLFTLTLLALRRRFKLD